MRRDGALRQSSPLQWLTWGLWGAALAGLAYLLGLTVWLGATGLFFPYQLDYGEGTHLFYVKQWLAGRPIYRPIGSYPYITSNYAPLPFLLAMAVVPLLGTTYAAGRIWTLAAIVAVMAIVLSWVRRATGRWLPGFVAALAFVGSPYVYHWAPMFRVDLVGLALTVGGLYAVHRWLAGPAGDGAEPVSPGIRGRQRVWPLGLAVVLFVAALYTKQSFVFAPAAALAYLFVTGKRRQAAVMAAAIVALGGGLFLAIDVLTGGSFWQSLVVANVNTFLWPEFLQQQADFFGTFVILGLLSAWYLVDKFVLDYTVPLRQKIDLLDFYLPAALLSVLLAGKVGSWENYFFEALVALSLCAGLGLARLIRSRRSVVRLAAPLLVLGQVALMWHTPRVADRYIRLTRQSYEEMAPILASTPDPIFSEDMGLLVTYGKVLDYQSFEYSQLARVGRWDQAWELDQLRNRRRSLVILEQGTRLDVDRYGRFTREFLSELDRNYRFARTVGKYEVYEPDPLQHEPRPGAAPHFGDQLALAGWSVDAPPDLKPGDTIHLTTVWQALQAVTIDYNAFVHLVDEAGQRVAGDDHAPYGGLYPTTAWGAGEMVRDTFTVTVPADAPPGLYTVDAGWYDPATEERLPVGGGSLVRLAVLPIAWKATGTQTMSPTADRFGEQIDLQGFAWQAGPDAVRVTLRWSSEDYVNQDYTVFVHLAGQDGQVVAQGDAPPLDGRWPTSLWLPGIALDDVHTVTLPAGLPPGPYDLVVGLYDPATAARLSLPDGSDALHLAQLQLP
jgi:hypothetical protein